MRGTTTLAVALVAVGVLANAVESVIPTGRIAFQLLAQRPEFAGLYCAPSRNAGWGVSLPESQNSRWKHIRLLADAQPANADGCVEYMLASLSSAQTSRRLGTHAHGEHTTVAAAAVPRQKVNLSTLIVADRGNCSFVQKALIAQRAGAKGLVVRGTRRAAYEAILAARNGSAHDNTTALATSERPPFDYDCTRGESFVPALADPAWATDDAQCSRNSRCASKMCIPTGAVDRRGHQVCCLWDTHVLMGANLSEARNVSIPVVFVTIADGQQLARSVERYPELLIRTYQREVPLVDIASVLLWVIGVATALGASYYAAAADRRQWLLRTNPNAVERKQEREQQQQQSSHDSSDVWEIDTKHAIGFIVSAGLFLTVFYYVKIGGVIPILFALSAAGTLTQLVVAPSLDHLVPAIASRELTVPVLGDTVALSEVLGLVISGSVALVWYVHRRTYWALQDVFGISLCFVFLKTVQLPNLKVATLLLSLAFVYDVFFVFISPAIFGSSVMEDVATGGPAAYTRSDYPGLDYCERYPSYAPCVDPEPMPMLLVLPRILDWVGGVSMLGLGDIILPGLLLSFALRFDYSPKSLGENYYQSLCIGYAVGLGMANIAVTVMQTGQPALMYLVPTTLGTLLVRAWTTGDFRAMWSGAGLVDSSDNGDAKRSDEELDNEEAGGFAADRSTSAHRAQAVNDSGSARDSAPLLGSS